jgi:nitrite reductase/ring-hydroxylating ferredoxin subunit
VDVADDSAHGKVGGEIGLYFEWPLLCSKTSPPCVLLSQGFVDGDEIEHAALAKFHIPTGKCKEPGGRDLASFEVRLEGGRLF